MQHWPWHSAKFERSTRILTAGHCGYDTVKSPTGKTIGEITINPSGYPTSDPDGIDAALIQATPSAYEFIGEEDDTTPSYAEVVAVSGNVAGDHVCTDGANSGEHCGLTVQSAYAFDVWADIWCKHSVQAVSLSLAATVEVQSTVAASSLQMLVA